MPFCQPPTAPQSINFTMQSKCNHNAINRAALLHCVKFYAALRLSRQKTSVNRAVEFLARYFCIIVSQNFCRVAAFFARRCSTDNATKQKINGQKAKKPCKISILAPTVEKAQATVEKAQATVEKAHPTVEKAQ